MNHTKNRRRHGARLYLQSWRGVKFNRIFKSLLKAETGIDWTTRFSMSCNGVGFEIRPNHQENSCGGAYTFHTPLVYFGAGVVAMWARHAASFWRQRGSKP